LFAARLSRYTSAYSPVVRYCSESNRHRYRKKKKKKKEVEPKDMQSVVAGEALYRFGFSVCPPITNSQFSVCLFVYFGQLAFDLAVVHFLSVVYNFYM